METRIAERYEIRGVLGEGGLGTVYRAHDARTGTEVALKVLRTRSGGEGDRLRFGQEFRALARLHHPNLVAVHDYGVGADGAPYFTMELVPGHDLHALMPLAPDALLALLPQLGRALGYLHQQGLVHGDVKPENVRITPDGSVKLMDLGFVQPAGQAAPVQAGTLSYVSPELIRGDRVDARADQYALGATCYHVLAGRPPFTGASPRDVLRAHLTRRPRSLRELDPTLPTELDRVIAKMMAREPVARYDSIAEALEAMGLQVDPQTGTGLFAGAFVGRAGLVTTLHDALRAHRSAARTQHLVLAGVPGVGKTRLLDELRVLAQLDDLPYFYGPCAPAGGPAVPYAPFVAILRAAIAHRRACLEGASAEQLAALGRLLPELAPAVATPDAADALAPLEPREERALIHAAIAHVLRRAAGPAGAALALDDWDRTDAASVATLAYLLRNAHGIPFLVVATARDPGTYTGRLETVPPLTQPELAALAGSMLGAGELPAEVASALYRWTGGLPVHVGRVMAHLVETGALRRAQGRWVAAEGLDAGDMVADLGEGMLASIANLPDAVRGLAELLAVMRTAADMPLLKDLAGVDEEAFFAALDALRGAGVITVTRGQVAFTAGGLAASLYERIPDTRRINLHATVAALLEARLGHAAQSPVQARTELAHHLLRSRQAAKALPAAQHAADLNVGVCAMDTARGLLLDGLALLAGAPQSSGTGGLQPSERNERMRRDFLVRLAAVERWRGDFEALSACLDEAVPLCERLGDPTPLAHALMSRAAYHIQRMTRADLETAIATLERIASLPGVTDGSIRVRGRFFLGEAHFFRGQLVEARQAFEEAARLATGRPMAFWRAKSLAFVGYLQATGDRMQRDEGFARLAEANAIQAELGDTYGRGFTAALQGDALLQRLRLREAEAAFRGQIAVSEELAVGEDHVTGLANLAAVLALLGRQAEAIEASQAALPLAAHHQQPVGALAQAVAASVEAGLGDLPGATSALMAAEAAGRDAGAYLFSNMLPFLAQGWLRLGRAEEARRVAHVGLEELGPDVAPALGAQLRALQGEALLLLGQREAAEAAQRDAASRAAAGDFPLATYLALRLRARLALAAGDVPAARAAIAEAHTLADVAGSPGFAAEAAMLAGELGLRAGDGTAVPAFRALQAYADREGSPYLRALALHGQAEAEASGERAEAMLQEAQAILRSLTEDLDPAAREAFQAMPEVSRALALKPQAAPAFAIDSGPQVFDRIKAVSTDLLAFANQYGTLFKEWSASTRRLEMLNDLAHRINESLDLDEVLVQAARTTLELTGAERAFVLLADPLDPEHLACRAALDREGRSLGDARVARSVCRRVHATGEAVCVIDATQNEELQAQPSIADLDLRTLMCVQLAARGQALGVLYVDSRAVVGPFTRNDLALLKAIASHASVAIGNASIYAESRQRSQELARALDMYREAMRQANTDALTGLNNRRCFEELAAREMDATRRYQRHLTVILLDVDHFKSFNDTYGHALGDEVLKAVAQVVDASVRVCDVAARMGGEEFAVLCPETPAEGAVIVAERIRRAIAAVSLPDQNGEPVRPLTVSLGVATYMPGDKTIADPLARADEALYACKRGGRNQHQIWRPGILQEGAAVPDSSAVG